jgi:hypothetical protein
MSWNTSDGSYTKAEGDRLVEMYNRERERADAAEKKLEVMTKILTSPELLEEMAAIEHARWAGWETYREETLAKGERRNPDDPESHLERWKRQRETPYRDLSEKEKESDRVEARKTRNLITLMVGLD